MREDLIQFMLKDLSVSSQDIDFLLGQTINSFDNIYMILWQNGLIDIDGLSKIFDWLDTRSVL